MNAHPHAESIKLAFTASAEGADHQAGPITVEREPSFRQAVVYCNRCGCSWLAHPATERERRAAERQGSKTPAYVFELLDGSGTCATQEEVDAIEEELAHYDEEQAREAKGECPATTDGKHDFGGDYDACMACGFIPQLKETR